MNRSHPVTRGVWLAFGLSAMLAGAAWFTLLQWRPVAPDSGGELATLTAEYDRLKGYGDSERAALRQQRDALRREAWTAGSLATLQAEIGAGWRWDWKSPDCATLRRVTPQFEEWPGYVALVTALGKKPGLIVESVELRADGAPRERRFSGVSIGLRFILADAPSGDAEPAAPSRAPLPVAPATAPAPSRKIGPVPSLRRPSASAEPPAPGPASTPFRPDPPGPSAGISTNKTSINPQEYQR
jgi:hypothetical protein